MGIYYGTNEGLPLGPFFEDQTNAQERAKEFLKCSSPEVYRVEAMSSWEARTKIDVHLSVVHSKHDPQRKL